MADDIYGADTAARLHAEADVAYIGLKATWSAVRDYVGAMRDKVRFPGGVRPHMAYILGFWELQKDVPPVGWGELHMLADDLDAAHEIALPALLRACSALSAELSNAEQQLAEMRATT